MASFCQQCSVGMFGEDFEDMKGLCTLEDNDKGLYSVVLCEDCGPCQVDRNGRCVSEDCMKQHGAKK